MTRRAALLAYLCIASAFAGGCATAGPNETTVGAPSATTFLLRNHSRESICYIFIASDSSDAASGSSAGPTEDWGPDRLGPTEVVLPGGAREWDFSPGQYRVKLEDCNRHTVMEREGVTITAEGVVLTFRQRE